MNDKFEKHKVSIMVNRYGKDYSIYRKEKNEFGELTEDKVVVSSIKGVYHEQNNGYVTIATNENSQTTPKKNQMIICLFDEVEGILPNDIVQVNEKLLKISKVINVHELNVVANICLEEL